MRFDHLRATATLSMISIKPRMPPHRRPKVNPTPHIPQHPLISLLQPGNNATTSPNLPLGIRHTTPSPSSAHNTSPGSTRTPPIISGTSTAHGLASILVPTALRPRL